jgi:hypothetical protein
MLLIVIKTLTTFPLPGDRDYYEGFAKSVHNRLNQYHSKGGGGVLWENLE